MPPFWTTAELIALGRSREDIRRAVESDQVRAVRKGHWAAPGTDEALVRAARVGGVATATTAARAMGLWTPPDALTSAATRLGGGSARLHVAVPRSSGRLHDPDSATVPLRSRPDVEIHWVDPLLLAGSSRSRIAPPLVALSHLFAVQPPDRALTVVDSALKSRHLRPTDLPALAALLPARLRPVLDHADGRAESGTETVMRYRLRMRGLRVEVLPRLHGIGEVDLLVEGRLIVECDGGEFHDDQDAFHRDRRRDSAAARARYRVLRFTWFQVLFEWEQVEAAVFAALAA